MYGMGYVDSVEHAVLLRSPLLLLMEAQVSGSELESGLLQSLS